jgi:transposase
MRSFRFSDADLVQIAHDRYHHPHPRVQEKMEVLWLKSRGVGHTEIARLTGLSRNTVQRYLNAYHAGGLAACRELQWAGQPSVLHGHAATLEDYFLANPPRSTAEAQAAIARLTGVQRGLTQVRQFLKKLSDCAGARSGRSRPRSMPRPRPSSWRGVWARG